MKHLIKIICFIGGIALILKITQIVVDVLYNNYGKRYITTEEVE